MKWLHCYIIKSPTGVFTKYQKNRHHVGAVKINWWNHFRKIAVCRSRSLLQIAGSSFRKLNRKERKGGGLVGRFCVPLIWPFVSLAALKNEGRNKARQLKTKERNISENIGFRPLLSYVMGFAFLFVFLFCLFFSFLVGGGGCSSINIFCCHLSWNANDTGTRAANGSCSEGSLKNILCIWSPHRQWSRTANDPWRRRGPQMISQKNGEWHGVCFHVFIHSFHIHLLNVKKIYW